jgi:hypothetical protein
LLPNSISIADTNDVELCNAYATMNKTATVNIPRLEKPEKASFIEITLPKCRIKREAKRIKDGLEISLIRAMVINNTTAVVKYIWNILMLYIHNVVQI